MSEEDIILERQFYKEMSDENVLQVVMKAALYIERELTEIIAATSHDPSALKEAHLEFNQKVHLAIAAGLDSRFKAPLLSLAKVRNRFAHELGAKLDKSDADNLYKSFHPDDKGAIQRIYESTRAKMQNPSKQLSRISSLDPDDRFRLYATTLRGILIVGKRQALSTRESAD